MKQTAVEFLVEKLKSQGLLIGEPNNLIAVREAKEIDKQNIISAYQQGYNNAYFNFPVTGEEYYNETFNKQRS